MVIGSDPHRMSSSEKGGAHFNLSGIVSRDLAVIRICIRIVRCQRPAKRQNLTQNTQPLRNKGPSSPPLLPVGRQESVLKVPKERGISRCDSCDNATLQFVCTRCTRETDGIAAKLLRCGIASEALRQNMPLRQFAITEFVAAPTSMNAAHPLACAGTVLQAAIACNLRSAIPAAPSHLTWCEPYSLCTPRTNQRLMARPPSLALGAGPWKFKGSATTFHVKCSRPPFVPRGEFGES